MKLGTGHENDFNCRMHAGILFFSVSLFVFVGGVNLVDVDANGWMDGSAGRRMFHLVFISSACVTGRALTFMCIGLSTVSASFNL